MNSADDYLNKQLVQYITSCLEIRDNLLSKAWYLTLNDWSRGEQWILFPENPNVSRDEAEGNIEILGKQNSLFPKGPVIKWFVI